MHLLAPRSGIYRRLFERQVLALLTQAENARLLADVPDRAILTSEVIDCRRAAELVLPASKEADVFNAFPGDRGVCRARRQGERDGQAKCSEGGGVCGCRRWIVAHVIEG